MEFTIDYEEFADRVIDTVDDLNDVSLIQMDEPSDRELLLLFLGLKAIEEIKLEQAQGAVLSEDMSKEDALSQIFKDIFGDIGE